VKDERGMEETHRNTKEPIKSFCCFMLGSPKYVFGESSIESGMKMKMVYESENDDGSGIEAMKMQKT